MPTDGGYPSGLDACTGIDNLICRGRIMRIISYGSVVS